MLRLPQIAIAIARQPLRIAKPRSNKLGGAGVDVDPQQLSEVRIHGLNRLVEVADRHEQVFISVRQHLSPRLMQVGIVGR